jgi:hypothetical protein
MSRINILIRQNVQIYHINLTVFYCNELDVCIALNLIHKCSLVYTIQYSI